MTTSEKLQTLVAKCAAGVYVIFNQHKDYYETIEQHFKDLGNGDRKDSIDPEVWAKMIELNQLVDIQFYPHTPIGSFSVYHYDLDLALDQCIEILKQEKLL